jgi:predicted exporter
MRERIAFGSLLLLLAASAWVLLFHTRISTDLGYFLPRGASPAERLLVEQVREGAASRLILIGLEGGSEQARARASVELARRLRGNPLFAYVANGQQALEPNERALLFHHRYLLSPMVSAGRFSAEELAQALRARLDELASPLGALVKPDLAADPTAEFRAMAEVWGSGRHIPLRQGVWFSPDGKRALLVAATRAPGFDIDAQTAAVQAIRDADGAHASDGVRLLLTGPGVFSVQARDQIAGDAARLGVMDSLFLVGLLWLVYRSGRLIVLSFLPLLGGALMAAAAVSLLFGGVHGITLGFGSTLIGVANDYPIHLFTHMQPGTKLRDTLRHLWPTVRLGVLATVAGFSAMVFSGFDGLAQLGVFAVAGLFAAGLITRWVLPVISPDGFALPAWLDRGGRSLRLVGALRPLDPLVPALLLAALAYLLLSPHPLWDDDLGKLSPVSQRSKQLDAELRAQLGAPDLRKIIIVTGSTEQQALERSEALALRLQALETRGALAGFDMASRYLPSVKAQRERQAQLPDTATLRADLDQALRGLPFKPGLFEPFIADVSAARSLPPLTLSAVRGTALETRLDALLFRHDGQWQALVPLRGVADEAAVRDLLARWNQPGVFYLDLKRESDRLVGSYRQEALQLLGWGAAAIALLLTMGLGSWRRALRVMLPMAAAVAVTSTLLFAVEGGLSLFHLVSLLLVVGIAMDYALFFDRPAETVQEQARTLYSLLVCNATTVVAFGLLLSSHTSILAAIGSTVALGASLALLFAAMTSPRSAP